MCNDFECVHDKISKRLPMDERLTAILTLQHYLDGWRRRWHRQHKEQEAKAKERRSHAEVSERRPGKGYHLPL